MLKKSKKRYKKAKPGAWFVAVRGSYLPASTLGWWSYVPFLAYLIFTFYYGVKDTSKVSVAILYIIPNWVAAAVVMTFLASKKS